VTLPAPLPVAAPIVTQLTGVEVVQAHPAEVVIAIVSLPPAAAMVRVGGEIV